MPTDTPFEQRLRTLYAVQVPTELDQRIEAAMTAVPIRRPGRIRQRRLVALVAAAIIVISAAGPAVQWFEGWYAPFDRLWEISTPVDQTVTADGYRVTVHRAYADRLGVRLAMTVEDLEDRWSGLDVDAAEMTDADGRIYEAWNWSGSRTPVDGSSATWSRFLMPADARADDVQLRVTVTSLAVRAPDPIPSDLDPERIWTSVGGAWSFEFDMPDHPGPDRLAGRDRHRERRHDRPGGAWRRAVGHRGAPRRRRSSGPPCRQRGWLVPSDERRA